MAKSMILFDMQSAEFGPPVEALYPAMLEMAKFADDAGFDWALVSEHHLSPTNYLPSPTVLAAALAAVTTRMRIVSMVILPLHNPIEMAENIAVLDLVSQGRLDVIFGLGYAPVEFALFDVPMKQRGKIFDASLETVVSVLRGEPVIRDGRELHVTPRPYGKWLPGLYVGGSTELAAKRAARHDIGFAPGTSDQWEAYSRECTALGRPEGAKMGWGGPINIYVSEDPEIFVGRD